MTWRPTVRRTGTVAVVALIACLVVAGSGRAADEILTNELVIKLVTAGFSESVIIEKIQSSPSRFDTDIDSMIALKKAGVPEPVIQAMVRARRGSQVAAPDPLSSTPTTPVPGGPAPGGAGSAPSPVIIPVPSAPYIGTPGVVGAALGRGLLPLFSQVPVDVKDTVVYIKDDKQIELEYARGRVKRSGFMVYTSKLVLHSARAQLRVSDDRPTFYVGANPTDVPLVRFKSDPKDNDRTITVGKAMFIPYWSDERPYIDTDDTVPIDFEKLPSGYYKVTPKGPLPLGEYAFLREGAAGRAYDFGRD